VELTFENVAANSSNASSTDTFCEQAETLKPKLNFKA